MTVTTDALAAKRKMFEACREANVAYISPIKDKRTGLYDELNFQMESYIKEKKGQKKALIS